MNMKSGCYIPKLKEKYINEVIPEFKKNFGITNTMSVPNLPVPAHSRTDGS